ncbi:DUF4222 domain-containing protein [Enterobacter mori]|uniref:DUF4222 domain-containing protein n=1 Tax=Enterobacter mori TaxID=539813 RepID=UPI003B83B18C
MKYKKSGFTASGQTRSNFRPGDVWKDRHGSKVIILSASLLSVEYRRSGYDDICTCSPGRFGRDFEYVAGNINESDVAKFMSAADGVGKTRVLRGILQERLKK